MKEISNTTRRLLTFSMLKGIGPATIRKISRLCNFSQLSHEDVALQVPLVAKALQNINDWERAIEEAEIQIQEAKRFNARILSPLDDEYPSLLSSTKDDPYLLFVCGKFANDPAKSVAIIGTREPTQHGILTTQRITQFFAEEQWSVVSGLAIGCDAVAHKAVLDADGHTIAVLAHGLHTIAPACHRKLADDILASGGALVSEYRFGQKAQPQQFVKRDRTQAGLAQGVVMIQSDLKGGSLHASRAILDYKRWLIVPYPTQLDRNNNEQKVQANLLLAEGGVAQKENLLKSNSLNLKKLIILRSKEDYPEMIKRLGFSLPSTVSVQESLI